MRSITNQERRQRWADDVIASATYFTLIMLTPRCGDEPEIRTDLMRERQEFHPNAYGSRDAALACAKRARDAHPGDDHGRRPLVYAVGTTGQTVMVP